MNHPVNLNKMRKARARNKARKEADANAVKFGRSPTERRQDQADSGKIARNLDGAKLDGK